MSNMFSPIKNSKENTHSAKEGIAITPVPEDITLSVPKHSLGNPEKIWEYRDEEGRLLMEICRFIDDSGKKEDRPLTYRQYADGTCKWAWKSLDAPRPLYGLERLSAKPDAIVIVCEGEKAADAAQMFFPDCVAVTSPNGAGSPHKADWSPLDGRIVVVWPDHDDEGVKYAKSVEQILNKLGSEGVLIASIPEDFPQKWDLADPLPDGATQETLQHIFDNAQESPDPLELLIEECKKDPGYAYQSDIIEALNELKFSDKSEYMRLRSQLKKLNIGITELEKDMYQQSLESGLIGGEPDHLEIARNALFFLGIENLICDKTHIWFWNDSGVWKHFSDRALKQKIQRYIDQEMLLDVSKALVDCVTDVLKSEIYAESHEWNLDQNTINVLNGELSLEADGSWILNAHDRESYRTTQIPVEYDPDASCPRFITFLGEIFLHDSDGSEKADAILEMMGYTLVNHASRERFALLIGSGANGKSVVLEVLRALLGADNVAAVQPSQLSQRFQRGHLHMKMANLVTEIAEGGEIADAELKAITSGELMTAEHKHKDPFDFPPFCTCWFGSNHMPHTRDFSNALFRRALVIPFNRVFREGVDADPNLKHDLKSELPGILNLCLGAYAKVVRENKFTEPQSCLDAKDAWRKEADQVAQFVEDVCVLQEGCEITSGELYQTYKSWADDNGIRKQCSRKTFTQRLERLECKTSRGTGGTRKITGITLRNNYEEYGI